MTKVPEGRELKLNASTKMNERGGKERKRGDERAEALSTKNSYAAHEAGRRLALNKFVKQKGGGKGRKKKKRRRNRAGGRELKLNASTKINELGEKGQSETGGRERSETGRRERSETGTEGGEGCRRGAREGSEGRGKGRIRGRRGGWRGRACRGAGGGRGGRGRRGRRCH